jgi:hypothetical protein
MPPSPRREGGYLLIVNALSPSLLGEGMGRGHDQINIEAIYFFFSTFATVIPISAGDCTT